MSIFHGAALPQSRLRKLTQSSFIRATDGCTSQSARSSAYAPRPRISFMISNLGISGYIPPQGLRAFLKPSRTILSGFEQDTLPLSAPEPSCGVRSRRVHGNPRIIPDFGLQSMGRGEMEVSVADCLIASSDPVAAILSASPLHEPGIPAVRSIGWPLHPCTETGGAIEETIIHPPLPATTVSAAVTTVSPVTANSLVDCGLSRRT